MFRVDFRVKDRVRVGMVLGLGCAFPFISTGDGYGRKYFPIPAVLDITWIPRNY